MKHRLSMSIVVVCAFALFACNSSTPRTDASIVAVTESAPPRPVPAPAKPATETETPAAPPPIVKPAVKIALKKSRAKTVAVQLKATPKDQLGDSCTAGSCEAGLRCETETRGSGCKTWETSRCVAISGRNAKAASLGTSL